jgi:putative membrane-bound dehydrogenase-like protein
MRRAVLLLLAVVSAVLGQTSASNTAKSFQVADGLEATVWAAEPNVINPTNIDIDERGRVWYLEAVNYRRQLKSQPDLRKEGDRIVILEDTDLDGRADKRKIFHQDPSLRAPIGIAVLGNRVFISQSPELIVFTKDEHDRILKREVLLTGWKGVDHDHGLHAMTFGPDGRLYFNSGDQGFDYTDKSGNRWVSAREGPYYAGTALRMNLDGSGFTVLAHNFRNPYELAVDSFGGIWQSDNDDDGNAWTRFTYVMEGGNYGYWGPGGKSWQSDRGTHFHQENPGVVPNIARLGAGSPAGLAIYEGTLLPARFRGMPLHAEAGKRELRAYHIKPQGAGYTLDVETVIAGADTWFRPVDVAVAPDGSVFVADWYDAAVGGHNMRDTGRGRIYRLAPRGHKPQPIRRDLGTLEGLREALASPAQSVRFLAWETIRALGTAAVPWLQQWWKSDDPVLRARSLWLLAPWGTEGRNAVTEATQDPDERFRMLAVRVAPIHGGRLLQDPSPQVRREVAISLQHIPPPDRALLELAKSYDGKDRWYLEALGIGMRGRESALWEEWKNQPFNPKLASLLWRARVPEALPVLIEQVQRGSLEALEAAAALPGPEAAGAVAGVVANAATPMPQRTRALELLHTRLFSEWSGYRESPAVAAAFEAGLGTPELQARALEAVDDLDETRFTAAVLAIARNESAPESTRATALRALGKARTPEAVDHLKAALRSGPAALRMAALRGLALAQSTGLEDTLRGFILSKDPNDLRSEAVRVLVRSEAGANLLLDLEQKQQLPVELRTVAAAGLAYSRSEAVRARAARILPLPAPRSARELPPPGAIIGRQGDVPSGRKVFFSKTGPNCAQCHSVDPGKNIAGPSLAAIGDKLGKAGLLDAIMNPSAGIAHEYVTWILETKSQGQVIGVLAEDTPHLIVVKNEQGEAVRLKPAEVTSRRQSNLSMMPEDLVTKMSEDELVDLLEFLVTLKEQSR